MVPLGFCRVPGYEMNQPFYRLLQLGCTTAAAAATTTLPIPIEPQQLQDPAETGPGFGDAELPFELPAGNVLGQRRRELVQSRVDSREQVEEGCWFWGGWDRDRGSPHELVLEQGEQKDEEDKGRPTELHQAVPFILVQVGVRGFEMSFCVIFLCVFGIFE